MSEHVKKTRFVMIFFLVLSHAAMAQGFSQASFVYIECYDSSNARVSRGSGVLVSSDGRVLTAKHVIKGDSTCRASLGTGATTPSRLLTPGRASSAYDAMIVKLVPNPGEVFQAVRYARIATLQRKSITAYGVPIDDTGQVSVRTGIISTTVTDGSGHIQTDALTARGMSGGPVVLEETGALVGIVVGADLDVTNGLPTNYAVLAAQEVAVELELDRDSGQTWHTPYVSEFVATMPINKTFDEVRAFFETELLRTRVVGPAERTTPDVAKLVDHYVTERTKHYSNSRESLSHGGSATKGSSGGHKRAFLAVNCPANMIIEDGTANVLRDEGGCYGPEILPDKRGAKGTVSQTGKGRSACTLVATCQYTPAFIEAAIARERAVLTNMTR